MNSCIDVLLTQKKFSIAGYLDKKNRGKFNENIKWLGDDNSLKNLKKKIENIHISVGHIKNSSIREKIYKKLKKKKFIFPKILSPFSYISKNSIIDEGTVVMHGVVINAKAKIGKNCIINTGSIIEHDAIIGDNCHISTGTIINGGVKIGNNTFVGSGTVVRQEIIIGSKSFINANLFINKNLKKNSIVK